MSLGINKINNGRNSYCVPRLLKASQQRNKKAALTANEAAPVESPEGNKGEKGGKKLLNLKTNGLPN